jgi:hypothetical protein
MVSAALDTDAPRPGTIGVDPVGTLGVVRAALRDAILDIWHDDRDLFRNQAHERTIMFHVGRRSAKTVGEWPGGWSVDLEYNRSATAMTAAAVRTPSTTMPPRPRPKRVAGKARVPDLLVHHRRPGAKHNLLAVEAKLVPRGRQQEDVEKLNEMFEELGYKNAVYVKFYRHWPPDWHWIAEAGQRLHACDKNEPCPRERV